MATIGRPLKHATGPVVSITLDGRGAAWCDGEFSGDPDIVEFARSLALLEVEVPLNNFLVATATDEPVGALAAMLAYSPGRARIVQAPPGLFETLEPHLEAHALSEAQPA